MRKVEYRNRRAVRLENDDVRVTAIVEGGHIAEILDKSSGVNPLWTPPWPSIEPSEYSPEAHPGYGGDAEAKLLAGIFGHNLCLDLFGGPSAEEAAAGITAHGESSVAPYEVEFVDDMLIMRATLPYAQLAIERTIRLDKDTVHFTENVDNLSSLDRPIAWTQHVTLGAPFLQHGKTRFDLTATRSKTYEAAFGDRYQIAAEFDWPYVPTRDGGSIDLRHYPDVQQSAGFSTHLMDPAKEFAAFTAFQPDTGVLFGYQWRREDFPWCGIWEENQSRQQSPWRGQTIARGFEFGVSPMPESRRQMIDRGGLFGVPGYRWLPAKTRVSASYRARITQASGDKALSLWD